MLVYRIAKKDVVKDLTGTGAKLYGGRWNHRGTAVVYTSETRALATVEFLVHVSLSNAPSGLMIATIEIPDSIAPEDVPRGSLAQGLARLPAAKAGGGSWNSMGQVGEIPFVESAVSGGGAGIQYFDQSAAL